jgi:putative salt-induced outer membrane protein YdiY
MAKYFFRILWLLTLSQFASAGVLLLDNGDRISGELIVISGGELRWQSDLAGEIVVEQGNVVGIDARDLFEVELDARRQLSECQLQMRSDDQQQLLNCKQGIAQLDSWKLVNKVSARPLIKRDLWRHSGSISAAAEDTAGNTEEQDFDVDFKISARKQTFRNTLIGEYQQQRQSGVTTQDNRKLEYQFDYFLDEKWFLNSIGSIQRNVFQDLSSRKLIGGGVGYQFFDTEFVQLAVDGGLSWVEEIYSDDASRRALAFRENTDFSYRLNKLGLRFFHRHTFLQLFDRGGDWRIDSETGFKMPVIGRLNAQAKLRFNYVAIPSEQAESLDRAWLFGLNYDW